MRHRKVIGKVNEEKWRLLEVTLGSRDASIDNEVTGLFKFLSGLDPVQQDRFKLITGIDVALASLDLKNPSTIQALMMKKFVDSVGLSIIQEAIRRPSRVLGDIYLDLLEKLLAKNQYPEAIYVYSVYRSRGTPRTWLSIRDDYTAKQIEDIVAAHILRLSRSLTKQMKALRKPVMVKKVNGYVIHLLSKPIGSKVALAENGNVDVARISYSLIVIDLRNKKVGIVTGSKKEIFFAQRYLIQKAFKDALGPARNDVAIKGQDLLKKLIVPEKPDALVLQGVDFKKTGLKNTPSLKLQAEGNKNIDEALTLTKDFWDPLSITALKEANFVLPTDKFGNYKKVGVYTHSPDDWDRITLNTTHRNVTSFVEHLFLNQINERLDGVDIKETRFVLEKYDARYVIDKLLRHKAISTTPAIPKAVDEFVVKLTAAKLITKQESNIKRKCWNKACYAVSWDELTCPVCGQDDMRIVGEEIAIVPNEAAIIKSLSRSSDFPLNFDVQHYPGKQRNNEKKSVLGVFNRNKNLTTFVVIVSKPKDITFVTDLAREGFGVVAVIDPKMEAKADDIELVGCTAIVLTDIVLHLLGEGLITDLLAAVEQQEKYTLTRVFDNAEFSLNRLDKKESYNERFFEVDIKNIVQALVPDVIRLGTEYSGKKVPDGYLRYGVEGKRGKGRVKRLFGWDAKYSASRTYSLGSGDTRKQNGYINWLMDPAEEPSKFGKLGTYAIIANFEKSERMHTTLTSLAKRTDLPRGARIILVEDRLLLEIGNWLSRNWKQVIDNNSIVSDEVFKFLKRKPLKGNLYTISRESNWPRLKAKLEAKLSK